MVHLVFHVKLVLLRFSCQVEMFLQGVQSRDSGVLIYSPFPMTRSSTHPTVGARMLPTKLYLVVYYQVSLVNQTRITCSDFIRPSVVLLGSSCCTISHLHTPWGNCNKCSSMIVFVKDSVS